jgi:hypothetical protein
MSLKKLPIEHEPKESTDKDETKDNPDTKKFPFMIRIYPKNEDDGRPDFLKTRPELLKTMEKH